MTPTELLKHEHQIILQVLDAAEREAADPATMDLKRVDQMVDFFSKFADRCHHAKEQDLLFPAMAKRGLPMDDGPILVMLREHDQGRNHVRAIFLELEEDEPNRAAIARHLLDFATVLRGHISREDEVVYPMADNLLGPADVTALARDFERVEAQQHAAGIQEKYRKLAGELAAQEVTAP